MYINAVAVTVVIASHVRHGRRDTEDLGGLQCLLKLKHRRVSHGSYCIAGD